MTKINPGKQFEQQFQASFANVKPKIFFFRIKDQSIPPDLRSRIPVAKNKYDAIAFDSGYLFCLELKSTGNKSISFDEKIIKQHQIDNLLEASTYENVIAGFVMNFRCTEANDTYFVPIGDFEEYKQAAKSEIKDHTYAKLNKSSIPIEVCEQIGIKINNVKLKTNYRYDVKRFIEQAIEKYGHGTNSQLNNCII